MPLACKASRPVGAGRSEPPWALTIIPPVLPALLERLSFGARPAELEYAAKIGAHGWIEEQLQPSDDDPRLAQALRQARLRIR